MKAYPILFSTEMVQAILDGTKTQTRRANSLYHININPHDWEFIGKSPEHDVAFPVDKGRPFEPWFQWSGISNNGKTIISQCPYGNVGDVLWVREMFCPTGSNEYLNDSTGLPFFYKADVKDLATEKEVMNHYGWKYKPSIHMPKAACRLFLEITNIRVERLQDITEADAKAEGVQERFNTLFQEVRYKDYLNLDSEWRSAQSSFESLWIYINGAESWASNPWVWVIEFKRIEKPENF